MGSRGHKTGSQSEKIDWGGHEMGLVGHKMRSLGRRKGSGVSERVTGQKKVVG